MIATCIVYIVIYIYISIRVYAKNTFADPHQRYPSRLRICRCRVTVKTKKSYRAAVTTRYKKTLSPLPRRRRDGIQKNVLIFKTLTGLNQNCCC
jgi:hypothetical protein